MITILVVDDSKLFTTLYGLILSDSKYKMNYVKNGAEALAFLTKNRVDIILLDIEMPHMNGADFISIFSKSSFKNTTTIIVVSSINLDTLSEETKNNVDHILNKPFDTSILKSLIDSSLKKEKLCQS
jgi:DNA-binding NtrC family response regulator